MTVYVGEHMRHDHCDEFSHPVDWDELATRILWWHENGGGATRWAVVNGLMSEACAVGPRFDLLESAIRRQSPNVDMNNLMGMASWFVDSTMLRAGYPFP